jgi:hypothetical protein
MTHDRAVLRWPLLGACCVVAASINVRADEPPRRGGSATASKQVVPAIPLAVRAELDASRKPPSRSWRKEIDQAAAILDGPLQYDGVSCFHELFKKVGVAGLPELQQSPHDSIAVQAAWQELAMTVPDFEKEVPSDFRVDRAKLNWFLGFLEGRGRVRLPKWWSDAILRAEVRRGRSFCFPEQETSPPWPKVGEDCKVTKRGDVFTLRVGSDSIVLPPQITGTIHDGSRHFTGCFTSKDCYVADFQDSGYEFTVCKIDRQTDKVVWTAQVWGSYRGSMGGSGVRGEGSIEVQGDRVVVFGNSIGIHVEAFRTDNGKNLFRFSNGYSY